MDVAMVDPGGRGAVDRGDGMREPDDVAAMIRCIGWTGVCGGSRRRSAAAT